MVRVRRRWNSIGRSRRRKSLVAVVVAGVIVSVLFVGIELAAADGSPPASPRAAGTQARSSSVSKEVLSNGSTAFSSGSDIDIASSSFAPIDVPATIKCKAKSCTALADATVTSFSGIASDIAICFLLDGVIQHCPFLGQENTTLYSGHTWKETFALSKGTHTLATAYYSDVDTNIGFYTAQYEVYADK